MPAPGSTGGPENPLRPPSAGRSDGAGEDATAARTAAQFAAAGLPTAQVWPPPGFEVAYLAAEATRAAEESRASAGGGRARPAQPATGRGTATEAPGHDGRSDPEGTPPSAGEVRPVEVAFAGRRGRTARPATARPAPEPAAPVEHGSVDSGGTTAPPTAAPGRLAGHASQEAGSTTRDQPEPASRIGPDEATGGDRDAPVDRRRDGSPGGGQDRPPGGGQDRPEHPARSTVPGGHRGGTFDVAGSEAAPPAHPAGGTPDGVTAGATAPIRRADPADWPGSGNRSVADPAGRSASGRRPLPDPDQWPASGSRPVTDPAERPASEGPPEPGHDIATERPGPAAAHDTGDDRTVPPAGHDTYRPAPVSPPSSFFLTRRPEQSTPAGTPSGVDREHGRAGQEPSAGRGPAETVPPGVTHPPVPSAGSAGRVDRLTAVPPGDVQVPAYPVGVVTAAPVVADGRPGPTPTTVDRTGSLTHRAAPPPAAVGDPELPEQVPAALVDGFRQRYGVDVAAVPVWRGAAATEAVQQAGARAATRGGEVLLPASVGPLDAPPARALLAHELAHVVQQRAFGATPPAESSGTGRDLEARALAAEHAFGDGGGPGVGGPLPPVAPPADGGVAPTPAGAAGIWGTTPGGGLTWQAKPGAGGVPPAAPTGPPAAAHPLQRAAMDTPAATLDDLRALVRGELDQQQDADQPAAAGPPPDALRAEVAAATAAPAIDRSAGRIAEVRDAVDRLRAELRTVADGGRATAARLDREAGRVPDRSSGRPVDLENPDDLEELAGRLYGRLRGRLRQELLVDRERSGRLTQFR
ncbi:eCIS core domain-containing protein [Micromonospora sp. WMMD723]|uniref:eCIS core domain-containing protein n=1 Tax=Micromonospora sp. WMMD723 TaxID=3403465 RepID=UPI003CF8D279